MTSVILIYWAYRDRRRYFKSDVKAFGLAGVVHWELGDLSEEEESGTQCGAVKCVDIWKNTSGESGSLVCN